MSHNFASGIHKFVIYLHTLLHSSANYTGCPKKQGFVMVIEGLWLGLGLKVCKVA